MKRETDNLNYSLGYISVLCSAQLKWKIFLFSAYTKVCFPKILKQLDARVVKALVYRENVFFSQVD